MARQLLESTVQDVALRHLKNWYARRWWFVLFCKRSKLFAKKEVRTHKRYGGNRADGLIAYRHPIMGERTISMEAKSFKTLAALKPIRSKRLFIKNCITAGLAVAIAVTILFTYILSPELHISLGLFGAMFAFSSLGYGWMSRKDYRHKVAGVLQQIRKYPANARWVAISRDSYNRLTIEDQDHFKQLCKHDAIGIVIVENTNKAEIIIKPRWTLDRVTPYLDVYASEEKIRQKIA